MKILLLEPGTTGHRPVILRYVAKVLSVANVPFEVETKLTLNQCLKIVRRCQRERVNILYVLTADGRLGSLLRLSILLKGASIKLWVNYYLYSNFERLPHSAFWKFVLSSHLIHKVFVSAPVFAKDEVQSGPVVYLPDPWDPDEFPIMSANECRIRLKLPQDSLVFLLFGELNRRKVASTFFDACDKFLSTSVYASKVVILISGRIAADIEPAINGLIRNHKVSLKVYNKRIEEGDVSMHFCAADYVVAPYPKSFLVSSGTQTRAQAAGIPLLASAHGVVGDVVKKTGTGILFQSDDENDIVTAFESACHTRLSAVNEWEAMGARAAEVARRKTIECYGNVIINEYSRDI